MNIYAVPMLVSAILCTLLTAVTWLFRRREKINRIFSFFTLALAIDAISFFLWFQFGSIESIDKWVRFTFSMGFLVPIGLIFFFFAFTGYDKRLDDKILGIKARHYRIFTLLFILTMALLGQFTDLIITFSETPKDIWDVEFGSVGQFMFPIFAGFFVYLAVMVFKGYQAAESKPQKRFILLLAGGTAVWVGAGYLGALIFPVNSEVWNFISYLGTAAMAVLYFVAIVNYQSDKLLDLNINLEQKVDDRTRELQRKNAELEDTLFKLEQMQKQAIIQAKMASLGQLVAGLTHEFNTPIGAIRSMNDTKSKAVVKLQAALDQISEDKVGEGYNLEKVMDTIVKADRLIDQGAERLDEIIRNLKNFVRLDEAEMKKADIHEGLDSTLALMKHDLLTNIEVVREYGDIPSFVCHPQKLNQVFLNLLKNACQAIEDEGRITITTSLKDKMVYIAIRDTGKGIEPDALKSIFDPGFTTRGSAIRTSLGLPVANQIIQEHHGRITVESQPGKGSVFTVILPLEFRHNPASRPAD